MEVRSGPFIFGGPVPPPYLEAVSAVVDILNSPEYDSLRRKPQDNMDLFLAGIRPLKVKLLGGVGAVVSIVVGGEEMTLEAGKELFERGYYVQSVVFPGVPHHGGLLRIQVNANYETESVAGLVAAISEIHEAGLLGIVTRRFPANEPRARPMKGLRNSA